MIWEELVTFIAEERSGTVTVDDVRPGLGAIARIRIFSFDSGRSFSFFDTTGPGVTGFLVDYINDVMEPEVIVLAGPSEDIDLFKQNLSERTNKSIIENRVLLVLVRY